MEIKLMPSYSRNSWTSYQILQFHNWKRTYKKEAKIEGGHRKLREHKRNTLTKNVIKVKLRRGDILLRYRDGIRRFIYLLLVAGL
jgi:hypothetical protein